MVAGANDELYSPFPRVGMAEDGPTSSEEGSDLHSPVYDQPFPHLLPDARYRSTDSVAVPLSSSLIASPFDSPYALPHTQPGDPHIMRSLRHPNTHPSLNRSDYPVQSFTSSAFSLGTLPPRFSSLADPTFDPQVTAHHRHVPQIASASHTTRSSPPHSNLDGQSLPSSASASTSARPPATANVTSSRAARGARKEISNVVIACRQCRARKIRCDSTRPECNNCVRRNNECIYDAAPKRRGPDKRPGTRQRSCKKRPTDGSEPQPKKKRKPDPTTALVVPSSTGFKTDIPDLSPAHPPLVLKSEPDLTSLHIPSTSSSSSSIPEPAQSFRIDGYYDRRRLSPTIHRSTSHTDMVDKTAIHPFDLEIHSPDSYSDESRISIPPVPSTQFSRKVWWDDLLTWYSPTREQSLRDISTDLNLLFTQSSYWLTFINTPFFLRNLHDQDERSRIQPSLVLAGLALATLVRSSELELGAAGRHRAIRLRDAAQSALEASSASQWIDLGLAEAAMFLALFETSAHPQYSAARSDSALMFLDNIIASLRLTYLDANDPDPIDYSVAGVPVAHSGDYDMPKRCECINIPLGVPYVASKESWSFVPAWDSSWSPSDIRKEETRRLCWSALMLAANHTSSCASSYPQRKPMDLFLVNSANFKLLFPGEALQRTTQSAAHSGKDTVWALYCRSMLLWNCCVRFQDDTLTGDQKTQIAIAVFVEIRAVEQVLDTHICNIDTALMYMCREFISNTRLSVTYLMRRLLLDLDVTARPVWNRRLAEEWLYYQEQVAKRVKSSIHRLSEPNGHLFLRRPFQISWFTGQVAICLDLWFGDPALVRALELAKSFLVPIEVLNAMWPCPAYRSQCDDLRSQLHKACAIAGIPSPLAPEFSLPPALLRV